MTVLNQYYFPEFDKMYSNEAFIFKQYVLEYLKDQRL